MRNAVLLFALQLCCLRSFGQTSALQITTNFPAGNVHVDSMRGNTVYLRPDLRDTSQDWFYWHFAVRSPRADSVRFVFTKPNCLTVKGPAVSTDGGKSWRWLYASFPMSDRFAYALAANQEVRFSMSIPYTQANWDALINSYRKHPAVRLETLCTTPKGRTTEKLVIRPVGRSASRKVLITARHHACEMMANYVMEGILATVLSDDSAMKALRSETEFWVIPFVDKDGVEDGDQGKFRAPRDHNRDYDGKSIYCSTSALRQQVPAWSKGQLRIAMDLHCPWIKGPYNEVIYVVGSEKPAIDVGGSAQVYQVRYCP